MAQISTTPHLLSLPTIVLANILDHLDPFDDRALLPLAHTCRKLYEDVIGFLQHRNVRSLTSFIGQVSRALLPNEMLISAALNGLQFPLNPIVIGSTFRADSDSFYRYKRLVVEELKGLNAHRLYTLGEELPPLPPCENIFALASIEHRIDEAMTVDNEFHRSATHTDAVSWLIETGDSKRALAIFQKISDESLKLSALEKLVSAPLDKDDMEQVVGIVEQLIPIVPPARETQRKFLFKVLKPLLENKKIDVERVLNMFEQINKELAAIVLQQIWIIPIQRGDIDRAIAVAERMHAILGEKLEFDPFLSIAQELLKQGNINRAIQIAAKISPEHGQAEALQQITVAVWLKQGKIERVIGIAKLIDSSYTRIKAEICQRIVFALLERDDQDDIDKAMEIAAEIPWYQRGDYCEKILSISYKRIAFAFLEKDDIHNATVIAEQIIDDEMKADILQQISERRPPEGEG